MNVSQLTKNLFSFDGTELSHMSEHFFGYGRWDAPYWFIGPEPGGTQGDDTLQQRYISWLIFI